MKRRTLLKLIGLAPFGAAATHVHAAPPKTMKEIEGLQENWKTLLAAGTSVPAPGEKLELSKDEWKKRLQGRPTRSRPEEATRAAARGLLNEESGPAVCVWA